ncbi:hypothetical protein yc1106_06948 [Curvularia clavata]|uniref:Uncharacterized protein n=1 Tax=Curvularia clavata TaxID=95742 RepID=A0A9Q9DVB0_CURCL|nr:hypothetical protein yc1106_06948 [Curvularia clavata]
MAPWYEKFITREDATPDPRRTSEMPALKLNYVAGLDYRRSLTAAGEKTPRYEIQRQAKFGGRGSQVHVMSSAHKDDPIAIIDFHMTNVTVEFQKRQHKIKLDTLGSIDPGSGLSTLHLKPTGGKAYGHASWEYRDENSLVMSVEIDDGQVNGLIALWKENLDPETVEDLILVGITKIEQYKRVLRQAKRTIVIAATA